MSRRHSVSNFSTVLSKIVAFYVFLSYFVSRERVLSTFYDLFLLVKGRSGVVVVLFTAKRSSENTLILVVCFFLFELYLW